ncbi:MAG: L-threonylcarbamoyladenylate synthase [Bacteroidales bacterium]|nr:L-threonylcarbamoyladenylate synthase [Candidatus Colicola coprequi]
MTIEQDIENAVRVMRAGGIILYPTDTVWGIGCDAKNAEAVARIYRLKQREESKAMLVLVARLRRTQPQIVQDGRPTTLIYPRVRNVAKNLLAEDGSLGMRVTKERFSRALCLKLGGAIVSTSANISGEPTAKTYEDISPLVRAGVDYICTYRRDDTEQKQPSRILKLMKDGTWVTIRD